MLFFVFAALAHIAAAQDLQVNTTQGVVQGANAPDGSYYTFYGVHYGGSTAGENRFKSPTPPPRYPGVFVAHDSNVICAQPSPRGLIGIEDCLTLNIFTNGTAVPKPVVVWLTGDEYTNSDDITRSFRNLVLEGTVVVQINHRVSIFGFLCLGVTDAPGNAGLKDVVQGLKWIKENIAGFGGNPNNVILFGHGSGAAMVDLITLSPMGKDLVHKAIVQSGSALSPWAVSYDSVNYAQAVGAKLGYTNKNNAELANLLKTSDINLLAQAVTDFDLYNNTILFAPCIERSDLHPNDTFLADAPLNILKSGNYSHIPYIAGYTDKEGTIRAEEAAYKAWLDKMQANFTNFIQADLNFGNNATAVERSIREFYFAQRNINMETIEDFLDYQGDTLILVSTIRGARERALTSTADVRLYEFAYRGTQNSGWAFQTIPLNGARHGSVINYLLDYDLRAVDAPVKTSLVRRFTAFFNTGVPNAAVNPGAIWSPVTRDSLQYLFYGGDGAVASTAVYTEEARVNPHNQRMTLWNDIYFKYYVLPRPVSSGTKIFGIATFVLLSQIVVGMF